MTIFIAATLSIVARIAHQLAYTLTDAVGFTTTQSVSLTSKYQMTYGASANDANNTTTVPTKYYEAQHTITIASSTFDIDLTTITDTFGTVLNFSKVYEVIVHNNDVSGGSGLIVKPGPSNGWVGPFNGSTSGQNDVPPGGNWYQSSPYAGFTVNGGTKVLRIQNDAASPSGSASFSIHIVGS